MKSQEFLFLPGEGGVRGERVPMTGKMPSYSRTTQD